MCLMVHASRLTQALPSQITKGNGTNGCSHLGAMRKFVNTTSSQSATRCSRPSLRTKPFRPSNGHKTFCSVPDRISSVFICLPDFQDPAFVPFVFQIPHQQS